MNAPKTTYVANQIPHGHTHGFTRVITSRIGGRDSALLKTRYEDKIWNAPAAGCRNSRVPSRRSPRRAVGRRSCRPRGLRRAWKCWPVLRGPGRSDLWRTERKDGGLAVRAVETQGKGSVSPRLLMKTSPAPDEPAARLACESLFLCVSQHKRRRLLPYSSPPPPPSPSSANFYNAVAVPALLCSFSCLPLCLLLLLCLTPGVSRNVRSGPPGTGQRRGASRQEEKTRERQGQGSRATWPRLES